ncbi:MAG: AMIN domain-containing protein [Alphaproteobacteria bacterium]|nr:AMIN domain-containing protein [Alphaproteobacteria bacterium]
MFHAFRRYLGLLLFLSILHPVSAKALDVEDIRFGVRDGQIRMVIDLSGVSDFRAFTLSDPNRLVIDLSAFEWNAGQLQYPKETLISDIRQGHLAPGISRIVFDIQSPVIIESAFILPKQGTMDDRVVIDYKFVSASQWSERKSEIHGNLKVEESQPKVEATKPPSNQERPTLYATEKPLIVIDPGHGGVDPGAVGHNKVYEKNVVLELSKDLRDELLATGKYRVALTRETDVFIRLKDRVKFARDRKADLFISIHADSIHKPNVHGMSIYTLSREASDVQTAKLAEKENQADLIGGVGLTVEDEQVAFILGDFLMNDTMNQSKFFANKLVDQLKQHNVYTLQNPHRYAGFAVLKAPDIPSILIEAGFMSNKNEAKLLNQPAHRKKMAEAIKNGVDAYFEYVYKNAQN